MFARLVLILCLPVAPGASRHLKQYTMYLRLYTSRSLILIRMGGFRAKNSAGPWKLKKCIRSKSACSTDNI